MGIIDFLQPWTMSKVAAMCHGIGIWVHLTALKKTVDLEFSTWFIHYTYYYITYMILDPIGKFWQVHQVFRVQQGGVHCDSMPKTRRSAWIYAPWQATVPPPLYGKRPTACDTLCDLPRWLKVAPSFTPEPVRVPALGLPSTSRRGRHA